MELADTVSNSEQGTSIKVLCHLLKMNTHRSNLRSPLLGTDAQQKGTHSRPKSNTGRLVTAFAVTAKTDRENNNKTKQSETNKQTNQMFSSK